MSVCLFCSDTGATEHYTHLHTRSLHDALPSYASPGGRSRLAFCVRGSPPSRGGGSRLVRSMASKAGKLAVSAISSGRREMFGFALAFLIGAAAGVESP